MEYIVLEKMENGFKATSFNNGNIIIFGSEKEAEDEAGENCIVAEIRIEEKE